MRKVTLITGPQGVGKTTKEREIAGGYTEVEYIFEGERPRNLTTTLVVIKEATSMAKVYPYIDLGGVRIRELYAKKCKLLRGVDVVIVSNTLTSKDFKGVLNFECIEMHSNEERDHVFTAACYAIQGLLVSETAIEDTKLVEKAILIAHKLVKEIY